MHTSIVVVIVFSIIAACHAGLEYRVYMDADCLNNQVSYYYTTSMACLVGPPGPCTQISGTSYYYRFHCPESSTVPQGYFTAFYTNDGTTCASTNEIWAVKNLNEPTYIVQYTVPAKRATMELIYTMNMSCNESQSMTVNKCVVSGLCDPEQQLPYETCIDLGGSSGSQMSCPAPVPVAPIAEPVAAPVAEPQVPVASPIVAPKTAPVAAPVTAPTTKASSGSVLAVTSAAMLIGLLAF